MYSIIIILSYRRNYKTRSRTNSERSPTIIVSIREQFRPDFYDLDDKTIFTTHTFDDNKDHNFLDSS